MATAQQHPFRIHWRPVKDHPEQQPLLLHEETAERIHQDRSTPVVLSIDNGNNDTVTVQQGSVVMIDTVDARTQLLAPTFLSPGQVVTSPRQRNVLRSAAVLIGCCGVFLGIVFLLVVQGWSDADEADEAEAASTAEEEEDEDAAFAAPLNAATNCTLSYDPDAVTALMREEYVGLFFNATCLAANGTGDPCDAHLAEEYTYRMFGALRFDRLVLEFA